MREQWKENGSVSSKTKNTLHCLKAWACLNILKPGCNPEVISVTTARVHVLCCEITRFVSNLWLEMSIWRAISEKAKKGKKSERWLWKQFACIKGNKTHHRCFADHNVFNVQFAFSIMPKGFLTIFFFNFSCKHRFIKQVFMYSPDYD